METGKYLSLWKKYLPVIRIKLKQSLKAGQSLQLQKHEFFSVGDRKPEHYTFNLEIQNGQVINDISGTAVARDLFYVLKEDQVLKEYFKYRKVKINMGKIFILMFETELL